MRKNEVFCSNPKIILRRDISRYLVDDKEVSIYFYGKFYRSQKYTPTKLYQVWAFIYKSVQDYFRVMDFRQLSSLDIDSDCVDVTTLNYSFKPLTWVRCNKCNCCAALKSSSLSARTDLILRHSHEVSYHVTFTLADYSPESYSLNRHFIGNVLRRFQSDGNSDIQYFVRGEYGNHQSLRPHYHVMLHDYHPSIKRSDYSSMTAYHSDLVYELRDLLNSYYHFHEINESQYYSFARRYGFENVDKTRIYNVNTMQYDTHYYLLHGHIDIEVMEISGSSKHLSSYLSSYVSLNDTQNRFVSLKKTESKFIDSFYNEHSDLFPDNCVDIYKYYRTYMVFDTLTETVRVAPFCRYSQLYGFTYLKVDEKQLTEFFNQFPEYLSYKSRFIPTPSVYFNSTLRDALQLCVCYETLGYKVPIPNLKNKIKLCNSIGVFFNTSVTYCHKFIQKHQNFNFNTTTLLKYIKNFKAYITNLISKYDDYIEDYTINSLRVRPSCDKSAAIARCNQFAVDNFKKRKL